MEALVNPNNYAYSLHPSHLQSLAAIPHARSSSSVLKMLDLIIIQWVKIYTVTAQIHR